MLEILADLAHFFVLIEVNLQQEQEHKCDLELKPFIYIIT